MKVLHSWLQDHVTDPLPPPETVAALLTAHVCEVDEVSPIENDTAYEVKVLPDRAHYLLSHVGIARELAILLQFEEGGRGLTLPAGQTDFSRAVTIERPERCNRYMALEVHNVHLSETPLRLETRLRALGQRAINPLVDIGNYAMFDAGQPIHIFDANKVVGGITVRLAKPGETLELLTGETVTLESDDLVIVDELGALALAGIKGGKRAEVTRETTHIIIEAANFSPSGIRRTATRLRLRNDSSKRFENHISPVLAEEGLALVARLIEELSPGAIYSRVLDTYPVLATPWTVSVTAPEIEAMLGVPVSGDEIVSTMKRLGALVTINGEVISVTPPWYRLDVQIKEDVADEIARIRGYADLPSVLPPPLATVALPDPAFYYGEFAKNVLVKEGYSEALLYTLTKKGAHSIVYPLASDKSALRENLSDHLEKVLLANTRNAEFFGLDTIKICEVGKVFPSTGERLSLAFGLLPIKRQKGETATDRIERDRAMLESAFGRTLPYTLRSGEFGAVIEIDLEDVLVSLPSPEPLATLGFTPLPKDLRYERISPYPFIVRDVAVFVPEGVAAETVHTLITEEAGPLRVRSWLFDTFSKEVEGLKKTSYAFRIIFQSYERTLAEAEIEEIMKKVYERLTKENGWHIR